MDLEADSIPATHDLRSPSLPHLRHRTHLKKYHTSNLPNRAFPSSIPYSLALATPSKTLVPELETSHSLGPPFWVYDPILHPTNPAVSKLTPKGQRRRVYVASCVAAGIHWGDHCFCRGCRVERRKMNERRRVKGAYKPDISDCVLEMEGLEFDEKLIKMGGEAAWWDEGGVGEEMLGNRGDAWAKLVDNAVGVWEGKRRRWVEERGWEVCSDTGAAGDWEEIRGAGEREGDEDEDEWDKVSVCTV